MESISVGFDEIHEIHEIPFLQFCSIHVDPETGDHVIPNHCVMTSLYG